MSSPNTLRLLLETIEARGDAPCVVAVRRDDLDEWSAASLVKTVRELSDGLQKAGVERGDRVALFAENSPQWVAVCLAVLNCGGTVVPLDTKLRDDVLTDVLGKAVPKRLFVDGRQARRLERLEDERIPEWLVLDADSDDGDARSWRSLCAEADDGPEPPEVEPDDVAVLFFTSGTTGPPKGVPLTHANIAFQLEAVRETGITRDDDRMLVPLPLHHVYPLVIGIFTPLFLGLPIVFPRSLTGPELVRAMREGDVSLVIGVPRLYSELLSAIDSRTREAGRLPHAAYRSALATSQSLYERLHLPAGRVLFRRLHRRFGGRLRLLASGGAALDPDTARAFEALGWKVATGYGLTETSPLVSMNVPGDSRLGSAGRPLKGVEVRIDPAEGEGREPEAEAEGHGEGEIVVRGPNVFDGYLDLPDKTEESFTDDGWFKTGDLGFLDDDGFLHVTGRASTLIVTEGGKNVQPDEVEEAYARSESVREAGVLDDGGRLVAVLVPASDAAGESLDDLETRFRELVDEVSRDLPSYQRISDFVVSRSPLPRTRLGKIRRHELEDLYRRIRDEDRETTEEEQRPLNVDEMPAADQSLLQDPAARGVWDLLAEKYEDRRLTPDGHLQLDLGVDSMEWLNLTLDVRRRTGVEITEDVIEEIDTVRDLLEHAAEAGTAGAGDGLDPLDSPEEVLTERQRHWLEPLSRSQRLTARLLDAANRGALRTLFRLDVHGLDNLPEEEPFVLVPNHTSSLDPSALAAAIGHDRLRRTSWAGFTGAVFENPVLRGVARLAQTFPVERAAGVSSTLAFGAAVLKRGRNLVWFAEGTRSESGELLEFRPGVGLLVNRFRVPAVPVYIGGTFEALPMGRRIPRPRRVTVAFGEPLRPDDFPTASDADETAQAIADLLHDRVAELARKHARSDAEAVSASE